MQFAGQRTDMNLKPLGKPVNLLIKMTADVLPDPDAVLVTGITPQQTLAEGITEADFLKLFHEEVATSDTIFVGYNSVRFDDEFMRFLQYRNFYDAYEWQWKDGRSRWDLLDLVRMTRALRPDGIKWPFAPDGKPSNRLELLTAVNKLDHAEAHDALSDVNASIAIARLIKNKQPKLFSFLLKLRDKKKVAALVGSKEPFVYSSGKYSAEYEKTTVAVWLADHPAKQGCLVYDLRHDPTEFSELSPEEIVERWRYAKDADALPRLPVKTLQFNRCPAVAPLSVLDGSSEQRLQLNKNVINDNLSTLGKIRDVFAGKVLKALEIMDSQRQTELVGHNQQVDAQLYDKFFDQYDKNAMSVVRAADGAELGSLDLKFHDNRLSALLPLYKARNFPKILTSEERDKWDKFCHDKLLLGGPNSRLARYVTRIDEISKDTAGSDKSYLLEELRLYAESILPAELDA